MRSTSGSVTSARERQHLALAVRERLRFRGPLLLDDREPVVQRLDDLVAAIAERGVDARVSVKSSQIGLDIGDNGFHESLAHIVEAANGPAATGQDGTGTFVWIDTEDHETADVTLDTFERHAVETDGNVGVCVQANVITEVGRVDIYKSECGVAVRLFIIN